MWTCGSTRGGERRRALRRRAPGRPSAGDRAGRADGGDPVAVDLDVPQPDARRAVGWTRAFRTIRPADGQRVPPPDPGRSGRGRELSASRRSVGARDAARQGDSDARGDWPVRHAGAEAVACAGCDDSSSGWPATAGSATGSPVCGSPGEPSGGSCPARMSKRRSRPASGSRSRASGRSTPGSARTSPGSRRRTRSRPTIGPCSTRSVRGASTARSASSSPSSASTSTSSGRSSMPRAWPPRPPRAASPSGSTWRGAPTRRRRSPSTSG